MPGELLQSLVFLKSSQGGLQKHLGPVYLFYHAKFVAPLCLLIPATHQLLSKASQQLKLVRPHLHLSQISATGHCGRKDGEKTKQNKTGNLGQEFRKINSPVKDGLHVHQ